MAENSKIATLRVSTQADLERDIDGLLATDAAQHEISAEALLGPLDIAPYLPCVACKGRGWYKPDFESLAIPCAKCRKVAHDAGVVVRRGEYAKPTNRIGRVIVGCESGPGRRLGIGHSGAAEELWCDNDGCGWFGGESDICPLCGKPDSLQLWCEDGLWHEKKGYTLKPTQVTVWMSWLRAIINQCDAAGVEVLVKQIPILIKRRDAFDAGLSSGKEVTTRIKLMNDLKIGWRVSTDPSEWPEWARRQDRTEGK
jgi:hypothetical protein